ncbi:MAG: hypothetical protein H6Q10_1903 [Acidobacteria bacterium]|nr:hypothetical protein [Acidobacteriota bacterium]
MTSTIPLRANAWPSWRGSEPPPAANPPPWIHTMTGRRSPALAGVQTFRLRQSSLLASNEMSPNTLPCTQAGPNAVASFTPCHAAAGCGACHRAAAAYGTPLNTRMPAAIAAPCTSPPVVRTVVCASAPPDTPRMIATAAAPR